jgi:hypothetical protein
MADGKPDPRTGFVQDVLALHPKTVGDLVSMCRSRDPGLSDQEFLEAVTVLNEEGRVVLRPRRFQSFADFLLSPYWNTSLLIVLVVSAVSSLLYFVANGFPWSLFQIIPGLLLVFYLPGHSFLRILLGQRMVQPLERIVLEIATSIVMIMLLGLLLNFSGLGLFSPPALAFVVVMNVLVALWASYEDFSRTWLRP